MNERMMRCDGGVHCAQLLAAFDAGKDADSRSSSPLDTDIWLVWKYEGDATLYDMLEKRDFPYNMETLLLARELRLPKVGGHCGVVLAVKHAREAGVPVQLGGRAVGQGAQATKCGGGDLWAVQASKITGDPAA